MTDSELRRIRFTGSRYHPFVSDITSHTTIESVGVRFSSSGFPVDVRDVGRVLPWVPSSVVAVGRKPFESISTSPLPPVLGRSPALGKSLSVPDGWVRTREDPRSWGSSRDESQATSHDLVYVFGFRRMRTGPFAFARGQISPDYYIPAPSVPPKHYRSGGAGSGVERLFVLRAQVTESPVLGVTCRPSFPGSPDRPPRVLASSFLGCVPCGRLPGARGLLDAESSHLITLPPCLRRD